MLDQLAAPDAPPEGARRPWYAAIAPYAVPLGVGGVVLAATVYFAVVDPNEPGHFPACPLRSTTGLDCPGCGGLRAVHALCRGDLGTALDQNLLATTVLLPVALIAWVVWLLRSRPGAQRRDPATAPRAFRLLGRWGPYALLALLLVFTVVRNLPAVPYLHSGIG